MPGSFRLALAAAAALAPGPALAQATAPPATSADSVPANWQRIESTHTPEGWICVNRTVVYDNLGFRHFSGAQCNGGTPPGLLGPPLEGWVDCARDRSQNVVVWLNLPAEGRPRPQQRLYAPTQLGGLVADAVCRGL